MTDLRRQITIDKVQAELWFCACLYFGSHDIALRDSCWLDPAMFSDAKYGKYWQLVRDGGDPLSSAAIAGVEQPIVLDGYKAITIRPDEYARRIADGAFMLNAIDSAQKIAKHVIDGDARGVRQVAEDLSNTVSQDTIDFYTAPMIGAEFSDFIDGALSPVVRTFIPQLDKKMGGLFPRDLIILAARPGMGKTALAAQIGRNAAGNGKKVLIASLEMDRRQLWARMACGMCEIDWSDVRVGDVTVLQRDSLKQASDKLVDLYGDKLIVIDNVFTMDGITQAVSHIRPDFVIIDHLGEVDWSNPDESEVVWYGKAAKGFRQYIGKRYGIPVLLVHQLNRDVETRADKRPVLSDLRFSGALEQTADVVLMMYREDYYTKDDDNRPMMSLTELLIRKNRQGKIGSVNAIYNLKKQWFT